MCYGIIDAYTTPTWHNCAGVSAKIEARQVSWGCAVHARKKGGGGFGRRNTRLLFFTQRPAAVPV